MNRNLFLVIPVCLLLFSCASKITTPKKPLSLTGHKKILIYPFKDITTIYGEKASIRCPICGNVFVTGKVEKNAGAILSEHLVSIMKKKKTFELIPPEQVVGVIPGRTNEKEKRLSNIKIIVNVGKSLQADAVLVGYVYSFRDRVGSWYSASKPASVAFDIHLLNVADGSVEWEGHFDETQKTLFENLFNLNSFIKRKGRWVTADEMAAAGIKEMVGEVFYK
ncbi:MAG: hypothetical protein HN737_02030 [Desulfobacterales bacterium]|jgi:hypothetical protein|nr:hypothetical protein [Desulfobacteraceae bacterium]MBT4365723.1 hypothetical protein [Desulfobacteraceae bacterium]MBT7085288.1 hypothetical protein [Desulfobacterales bacterium]MBT7696168.1 hypothetical protein [Desulfobacterales bacterium]